jgi:2-aminoadipate transaminase
MGRVFLDPGDVVIMESPSYLGAINAFKLSQPRFVEIPTDENGMIMSELEKVLATTKNVKFIYVIPDFQNPSGRTWPLERRKEFMEIVTRYEIPVVEDNPYGELRYKGEFLPALKSMDPKDLVVYLGTFSKILAPGTRIAWMCANSAFVGKFNLLAQAAVLQTSTFGAMAISKYLEMFDIDAHVEKIRKVYGHRAGVMVQAMKDYFPEEVTFTDPDGGLFTWAELPDYIDTKVMASQCLAKNVAYVPGAGFFPNGGNNHCMRLNYSCSGDEQIVNGIHIIGDIIKANLK